MAGDTNDLETFFTTFVSTMLMASVVTMPAILTLGYAAAWRRMLNTGQAQSPPFMAIGETKT
ncbi:MAG: hypothetical protein LBT71_02690 [Azoarcus sp.]|jgi:hypothetical protein|nr:hypothetical protein [Azoarcus sp.]